MGIKASGVRDWWADGRPEQTQTHWDTWQKEHRVTLPLAIETIGATAVYEIGCGPGPNLRLLRSKHPGLRIGGSDVSTREITFLREHLDGDFTIRAAPHRIDPFWDVMLSCFTMAYMYPEAARRQFRMNAARWMILIEPWGGGELRTGIEPDVSPMWHHDYPGLARGTGWTLAYRWPIAKIDYLTTLAIYQRL